MTENNVSCENVQNDIVLELKFSQNVIRQILVENLQIEIWGDRFPCKAGGFISYRFSRYKPADRTQTRRATTVRALPSGKPASLRRTYPRKRR